MSIQNSLTSKTVFLNFYMLNSILDIHLQLNCINSKLYSKDRQAMERLEISDPKISGRSKRGFIISNVQELFFCLRLNNQIINLSKN